MNFKWQRQCQECPDCLYSLDKLKDTWTKYCKEKGKVYGYKAREYFKVSFLKFRPELIFIVAYDKEDVMCLFVDHNFYLALKEKLERVTAIGEKLPDVAPSRLSKKYVPRTMQRFPSIRDFVLFNELLRQKNRAIVCQKRANVVYQLGRIEGALTCGKSTFLAFDVKVDEPETRILELGFVEFEFRFEEDQDDAGKCQLFVIRENAKIGKKRDKSREFPFGDAKILKMDRAVELFCQQASSADFLITSTGGNFLNYLGLHSRNQDVMDIRVLFTTCFPENKGGENLAAILQKLGIDFDAGCLGNAGNDAVYGMRAFCSLLRKEVLCCR